MRMLLVLRDSKSEQYLAPFIVPTLGVAYRNLADEVAKVGSDNMLANHPEDFQLMRLGTYDEDTGQIVLEKEPRIVCSLADLKVSPE